MTSSISVDPRDLCTKCSEDHPCDDHLGFQYFVSDAKLDRLPVGEYLLLRLDDDTMHGSCARAAALKYSSDLGVYLPQLAHGIREQVKRCQESIDKIYHR